MDDETRQYFQALSAQIQGLKESQDRRFAELNQRIDGLETRITLLESRIDRLEGRTEALNSLLESVKDSLEREIRTVREFVERMDVRLNKIAAGSHYVARLVTWSEKQDEFQMDILRRVQAIESRLDKLDKHEE